MDVLRALAVQRSSEEKVREGLADAWGSVRREDEGLGGCGVLQVVTHCVDQLPQGEVLADDVVGEVGLEAVTRAGHEMGVP